MSATGNIDYKLVSNEHLMALKGMTVDTIAYYLIDHPETRAVVDMLVAEATPYDTGLGTTPGMWQELSDLVEGEALPDSLTKAIYALCEGEAKVVAT